MGKSTRKKYGSHQRWIAKKRKWRHQEQNEKPVDKVQAVRDLGEPPDQPDKQEIARVFWGDNYAEMVLEAIDKNPVLVELLTAAAPNAEKQYARRLKGLALQRYLEKNQIRLGAFVGILLKAANVQHRCALLYARSISALHQMIPNRWWDTERKCRLLLAKETAMDMVKIMCDNPPRPSFEVTDDILEICYDQCNIWRG
jgi:hypothetical protein